MRLRTTLVLVVFAAVMMTCLTALCLPPATGNEGDPFPWMDDHGRDGMLDNQGGPDAYCYVFVDNVPPDSVPYEWIELRGDPSATWLGGLRHFNNIDNGYSRQKLPIGFSFPFYGAAYDCVRVSTNGFLDFTTTGLSPSNGCLPTVLVPGPMIAVFWDDLHLLRGGRADTVCIGYRSFGTYLVVEFDQIGFASTSCPNVPLKFQAILYANGHIKLQYHTIPIPTACANSQTIGIQQAETVGSVALNYVCNTTGLQPASGRAILLYRGSGTPNPVTNLAGQYVAPNMVLTWTDPTQDTDGNAISVDSVQVWLGAAGVGLPLATIPGGVQTYTDQSPPMGWRTYRLCAFHGGCVSAATLLFAVVGDPSYCCHFESDNGGWVSSDPGGFWEWGTPIAPIGGPRPHSGTRCWGTTLAGTYPAHACAFLDLSLGLAVAGPSATVEFWYWVDCQGATSADYDGANFKVSTDGGSTWTVVDASYNTTAFNTSNTCIPGQPGWSRRDSTWRYAVMPIGQFTGQTPVFRFTFGSNASTQYRGFFFDDLLIWGLRPPTAIGGTVRAFQTNLPIADARVWAEGWPDTARTNAAGCYDLPIDAGTYSVTFDHVHFCDTTHTEVVVVDGEQTTLDAVLRRPMAQIGRTSIALLAYPGVQVSDTFRISNNGGQCPLDFTIADTSVWLTTDPASGTVNPNQSATITVNVTGPQIVGDYSSTLRVTYNAEGSPSTIRVDLYVGPSEVDASLPLPTEFAFYPNYPNPFNAQTSLRFDLPQQSRVQIVVYNITGQEVARPVDGVYAPGRYQMLFDASDLPSGMYLARMSAAGYTQIGKMMLLK